MQIKKSWNIDINKIEEKITLEQKAIMPVHIFGLMCRWIRIKEIAEKYNLYVVEDAANLMGRSTRNKSREVFGCCIIHFFANKKLLPVKVE
jgi:perosamine synthetase